MDSIESVEFQIDAGLNVNVAINKVDGKGIVEEKEKTDKTLEKQGLGRPVGTLETKRKRYFDMINNGKNKPKNQEGRLYKN